MREFPISLSMTRCLLVSLVCLCTVPSTKAVEATLNGYIFKNGEFTKSEILEPNLPTIILVHGWKPLCFLDCNAAYVHASGDLYDYALPELTRELVSKNITSNVLTYTWRDAFTFGYGEILKVIDSTKYVGVDLYQRISEKLIRDSYDGKLHFITHSAGSFVAANTVSLMWENYGIKTSQLTVIDAPMDQSLVGLGYSDRIFHDQITPGALRFLDNYFGKGPDGAFGDQIRGSAQNGVGRLVTGFTHSEMQSIFYRDTIRSPGWASVTQPNFEQSVAQRWSTWQRPLTASHWAGGSGDWHEASHWKNGAVPTNKASTKVSDGSYFAVSIGTGLDSNVRLGLGSDDATIDRLAVVGGGKLLIESGRKLAVTGITEIINGEIKVKNADILNGDVVSLGSKGSLILQGARVSNGDIENSGRIAIRAASNEPNSTAGRFDRQLSSRFHGRVPLGETDTFAGRERNDDVVRLESSISSRIWNKATGVIEVGDSASLYLSKPPHGNFEIVNDGLISIDGAGTGGALLLGTAADLYGAGKIHLTGASAVLAGSARNGPPPEFVNHGNNIHGSGLLQLQLTNYGLIDANQTSPLVIDAKGGKIFNSQNPQGGGAGVLQASSGGTLILQNARIDNQGGTIQALDGSTVQTASNVSIFGGTVVARGSGKLDIQSAQVRGTTFDATGAPPISLANGAIYISIGTTNGTTLVVHPGEGAVVEGTITNNGRIVLSRSEHGGGRLLLDSFGVTFAGSGELLLSDAQSFSFFPGLQNIPSLVNDSNHTIRGTAVFSFPVSNSGTIKTDGLGEFMRFSTAEAGALTNSGLLQASNGGFLSIGRAVNNNGGVIQATTGGIVILDAFRGGPIRNGVIEAVDGGLVRVVGGSVVVGSKVYGKSGGVVELEGGARSGFKDTVLHGNFRALSGTLSDVVVSKDAEVRIGSPVSAHVFIEGSIENNGKILLSASGDLRWAMLEARTPTTLLTGRGEIVLANSIYNTIYSGSAGVFINDKEHTIRGTGIIRDSIQNRGTIVADSPNNELDLLIFRGGTNTGLLQARDGGRMVIQGGTLDNSGGVIEVLAGSSITSVGNALTNNSAGTLLGGTYHVLAGTGAALLDIGGTDVLINSANVVLSGAGAEFKQISSIQNNRGSFAVLGGRAFTTVGQLTNSAMVSVGQGSSLTLGGGSDYVQTAGVTIVNGQLVAALVDLRSGDLLGSGTIVGNVKNSGQVKPGNSPGILTITGDFLQTASGVLDMEIGGLLPGLEYDVLSILGTATLGGALNIHFVNGYLPGLGETFSLLSFGSLIGGFDQISSDPGFTVTSFIDGGTMKFAVTAAVPEPAEWMLLLVGMAMLAMKVRHGRRLGMLNSFSVNPRAGAV